MDNHGQVTLELVVSTTVVAVLLSCASFVLKAEWERGRCAYTVFEVTHGQLANEGSSPDSGLDPFSLKMALGTPPVSVTPTGQGVSGTGACGDARETISFKWLEAM